MASGPRSAPRATSTRTPAATNDGITKIIVKGGAAGKSKALVKGKGANLPDLDSDLPVANPDLPMVVQLRNKQNGLCWGSSFSDSEEEPVDSVQRQGTLRTDAPPNTRTPRRPSCRRGV